MYTDPSGLIPDEKNYRCISLQNDYHNIKVLIKQEVSGIDGSNYLLDGGTVPLDELREAFVERKFSALLKSTADL